MADGKVNITFATVAQLGGLNAVSDKVKATGRELKDFSNGGAKVVGALAAQFNGPLNSALGSSFSILTEMAKGGIWGAISQGISLVVTKFIEWRKEIEKQREERRKFLKEAAEGYARRVASYAEKAAQKEREAYEARVNAMKEYAEAQTKMVETVVRNSNAMASADARIRAAQRRAGVANGETDELLSGNRERSESAHNAVESARQALWAITRKMEVGSATAGELQIAEKNLAAAEAELAAVEAENAKRLRDRALAEETAAGEAQRKAEEDFARQLREEEAAEKRKKIDALKKQVTVLDQAIAAQKILADAWEKNARKARGKDFAVWLGETEAEEKAAADERRRFGRANAGAARRAQNIRNRGFWASARDKSWLARYDEWKSAQDPFNNAAAKEAEKLEKERAEKVAEIANLVKRVAEELEAANTQG